MIKSELAAVLEEREKLSGTHAQHVVDTIFASMIEALHRDENIFIRGFGSFMVRHYKPYVARNPKTGVSVRVKSRRLPLFIMSQEILMRINKGSLKTRRQAVVKKSARLKP